MPLEEPTVRQLLLTLPKVDKLIGGPAVHYLSPKRKREVEKGEAGEEGAVHDDKEGAPRNNVAG